MKKVNLRSIMMAFVVIASLSSYVFLSTVSVDHIDQASIEASDYESQDNETEVLMPDVELVKKVVQVGKALFNTIPQN